MGSSSNNPFVKAIVFLVLTTLLAGFSLPIGLAQTATNVNGTLSSNTAWTEGGSPYNLTGNVIVNNGVTLTIQPGTTVNLNGYYIQVNGTLHATGTKTNEIHFNNPDVNIISQTYPITFGKSSTNWDDKTNQGSIIENSILTHTSIMVCDTSPMIRNNQIQGMIKAGNGSISILNNTVIGGISTLGTALISNNIITYELNSHQDYGYPLNGINNGISTVGSRSNISITNNTVRGFFTGLNLENTRGVVSGNAILNCKYGIDTSGSSSPLIVRNLVSGCSDYGLLIETADTVAENNTITDCGVGVTFGLYHLSFSLPIDHYYFKAQPTLSYNNIFANSQFNFYSRAVDNLTFANNWWGATDKQLIDKTIYDFKNDPELGTVTLIPFLGTPNTQAMPNTNLPIPNSSIPPTIHPSPSVPEFPLITILPLFALVIMILITIRARSVRLAREKSLK